mgnify:CR=1 FL=1
MSGDFETAIDLQDRWKLRDETEFRRYFASKNGLSSGF